MKNTFVALALLSVVWLSGCAGAASPENKPGTSVEANAKNEAIPNTVAEPVSNTSSSPAPEGAVVQLTKAMFLEKVYNYEKNPKEWVFEGDKPCVIDFYADWCRPCKMVAPIMAELAEKYKGQITIYKINTDQERELAQLFGINSIPTMYFCPADGKPQMTQGAMDKDTYEKIIAEVLLNKK
jgi:thioredoxin